MERETERERARGDIGGRAIESHKKSQSCSHKEGVQSQTESESFRQTDRERERVGGLKRVIRRSHAIRERWRGRERQGEGKKTLNGQR